jgi:hypothetical protein
MLRQAFSCAVLAALLAIGPSRAEHTTAEHVVDDAPQLIELGFPRTNAPRPPDPFVFPRADANPAATITPALLHEIIGWVAQNFDLPASDELPAVAFTTTAHMNALRYRGLLNHDLSNDQQSTAGNDTVAVYDAANRTIYLPQGWHGATPAEMSVLVHEVVHHLQHAAKLPHACPEEREKLAYRAQERWLRRFDRSLSSEFGTDGFTLLVRTSCGF